MKAGNNPLVGVLYARTQRAEQPTSAQFIAYGLSFITEYPYNRAKVEY